jgi:hypothetical protein
MGPFIMIAIKYLKKSGAVVKTGLTKQWKMVNIVENGPFPLPL